MTKRTRAKFELGALPLDSEKGIGIAAAEAEPAAAEGCLKACPLTVGGLEPQNLARVATADVDVNAGSVDEVASATEAVEEGLEAHPFWALLIRAGYEFI